MPRFHACTLETRPHASKKTWYLHFSLIFRPWSCNDHWESEVVLSFAVFSMRRVPRQVLSNLVKSHQISSNLIKSRQRPVLYSVISKFIFHWFLGRGAAMIIESLRLFYHLRCFRCVVCHVQLGNGSSGTDVRVRNNKLHCQNCYSNDEGTCVYQVS